MDTKAKPVTKRTGSNVRPLRRATLTPRRAPAASAVLSVRSTDARPQVTRRVDARAKKHLQLEYDVQKLRAEVARLQQLRQLLETQALNRADNHSGSACRLIKTYFDVFQRGYVSPSPLQLRQHASTTTTTTSKTHHSPSLTGENASNASTFHPDAFLAAMMDDDVLGGGFRGIDVMIEQWKRYATAFVGTKIQFLTAEVSSVDLEPESGAPTQIHVTATARYDGHLTLAGVQGMFPHVMANAPLVVGLIGQNIGGFGRYVFVYDCQQKRVVECFIHIDMVGAFAKVVANATDLALLFGDALVTEQYYIGDDSDEKRAQARRGDEGSLPGDDSPPTTPPTSTTSAAASTPTLTSDEEELTRREMDLDRILC